MTLTRFAPLLATGALLLAGACSGDSTASPDTSDTHASSDSEADASDDTTTTAACNPILQTGCTAQQNCTFASTETAPKCSPEGAVAYGAECSAQNACLRGVCLSLNDTGYRCYKFCQTPTHCDGQAQCLTLNDTPYKVCEIAGLYQSCDILLQDCDGAKGCYPIASEPNPVCLPAGSTAAGETCTDAAACSKGLICINQRCKRVCDPNVTDPCGNFVPCSTYGTAGYCDE